VSVCHVVALCKMAEQPKVLLALSSLSDPGRIVLDRGPKPLEQGLGGRDQCDLCQIALCSSLMLTVKLADVCNAVNNDGCH